MALSAVALAPTQLGADISSKCPKRGCDEVGMISPILLLHRLTSPKQLAKNYWSDNFRGGSQSVFSHRRYFLGVSDFYSSLFDGGQEYSQDFGKYFARAVHRNLDLAVDFETLRWLSFIVVSPPLAAAQSTRILLDYSEPIKAAAILGVAVLAIVVMLAIFRFSLLALTSLTATITVAAFAGLLYLAQLHTQEKICPAARVQNVENVQTHSLVRYLTSDARRIYPELRGPLAGGKKGTREYVWDEQISQFKDVGFNNKHLWFKPSKRSERIDCAPD